MRKTLCMFLALMLCLSLAAFPATATNEQTVIIQDDDIFLNVGETAKLTALASGGTVTWGGGNSKIATVAADGTVTAIGAGVCHVYAQLSGGAKAVALVQVKEKDSTLLATATKLELDYDINKQELNFTVTYNGSIMPNQRLSIKLYSTEKKNGQWVYDSFYSFNNPLYSDLDIDEHTIKGSIRLGKSNYTSGDYKDFALDIYGEEVVGSSGATYTTLSCIRAFLDSQLLGDVNSDGKISPLDASLVLQYDAALTSSAPNGDVNSDGFTDSFDAYLILLYDAGLIGSFDAWQN